MATADEDMKRKAQIGMLQDPVNGKLPISPPTQAPPTAPLVREDMTEPWAKGQIKGGARQGADFARLGGGFGDANTDSMKHTFGRIAQNFEHTPQGLQALINDPEFKSLFPTATLDKDWINFGGQLDPHTGTNVGKVDVLHAFDPNMGEGNNKNWQWLTEEEAMGGGAPSQPTLSVGSNPMGDNSALMRILAELNATGNDEQSPAAREAIMQLLQGGMI